MCCARAIVTAKAKMDGHEQWNSIRHGRRIQEELALEIHAKAGVPLNQWGIEDEKTVLLFLVGYQIHLISRDHFNGIVYHINNLCHNYRKIHDQTEDEWIHCQDCGRYFKGPTCFNLLKKTTPLENATCTSYYKCKNCGQTMNKRMGDHICWNIYCKTCKDYYPSGHQC